MIVMLLSMSSRDWGSLEKPVEVAGEVAFESADGSVGPPGFYGDWFGWFPTFN